MHITPSGTITKSKGIMERKIVKLNCMVCNKEFEGEEPIVCCSGFECGCMGLPNEPVVCSVKCYDVIMKKGNNNSGERELCSHQ
jgi:hypothetical protein